MQASYIFESWQLTLWCDLRDSGEISLPEILPSEICGGPLSICKSCVLGRAWVRTAQLFPGRPQPESAASPKQQREELGEQEGGWARDT